MISERDIEKPAVFCEGLKKGLYLCPVCRKRIGFHHSYCHHCGQKLGWRKSKEG